MQNIRKKSLYFLIIGTLMFLAAAAFLSVNLKNPENLAYAEAGDIEFTIKMSEGGAGIYSSTDKISLSEAEDGYQTGKFEDYYYNNVITFIAEAQKYYKFSEFTAVWQGGGNIEIDGRPTSSGDKFTQPEDSTISIVVRDSNITNITVVFEFEAIPYNISTTAKYISNYIMSNENNDVENAEVLLTNGNVVKIGDKVNLSLSNAAIAPNNIDPGYRFFDYFLWNTIDGKYEEQKLPADGEITISENFLDKYLLAADEIVIVAAYTKTYSVEISEDIKSLVEITISNYLTEETIGCNNLNDIENYFGQPVDEGCFISIKPKDIPYFKFIKFTTNDAGFNGIINNLKSNHTIKAQYEKKSYDLSVDGLDSFGGNIDLSGILVKVEGAESNKFSLGDTISIELSNGLLNQIKQQGYNFDYYSIKAGATPSYVKLDNVLEIKATADFLDNYLNSNSGSIRIAVNFVNQYSLSVALDGNSMGTYTVSVNGGAPETYTGNFEALYNNGTTVKIVIKPSKYASYAPLGGVYTGEKEGDEITILLNGSNRKITVSFVPLKFSLTDKTKNVDGYSISPLDNLMIGDTISVSVGTTSNNKINNWTINGINVIDVKNLPGNIEYTNGILKIKITEDWLNGLENFEILNKVNVGLKPIILTAIIAPSVIVPLLIAVLLIFILANTRRKKFIKAELTEKIHTDATRNVSGFVSDLREGKDVGHVTKENVKAEMKKRKVKAEEEPNDNEQ